MSNRELMSAEIAQLRAGLQLLAGAVERLAAIVEMSEAPVPPGEGNVVPFGTRRAMPLSFADPNEYPVDEELRNQVLTFANQDHRDHPDVP